MAAVLVAAVLVAAVAFIARPLVSPYIAHSEIPFINQVVS